MRRLLIGAALTAVALNGAATAIGRGSFGHTVVVLIAAVYAGLPLLVIGIVLWSLRRRFPRLRRAALVTWTLSAVALSLTASMWLGHRLATRDIAEAKAYCERLAAQLDQYKHSAGTYPLDLSALRPSGDRPRLLRDSLSYSSDGGQFELTFVDPGTVLGGWSYGSAERRWVPWD